MYPDQARGPDRDRLRGPALGQLVHRGHHQGRGQACAGPAFPGRGLAGRQPLHLRAADVDDQERARRGDRRVSGAVRVTPGQTPPTHPFPLWEFNWTGFLARLAGSKDCFFRD